MAIQLKTSTKTTASDPLVTELSPGESSPENYGIGFYFGGTELRDVIYGTDLDDLIEGFGGNDVLYGYGGDDQINGGAGNDFISGGAGNDILYGNSGNDTFSGGSGADRFVGGLGRDTVTYADANLFVTINLMPTEWSPQGEAAAAGDTFNNIESFIGTRYDDGMIGDSGNNWFFGGEGLDYLVGGAGEDCLSGDGGEDHLLGEEGMDFINGGEGNDFIDGGMNADILFGGSGRDKFFISSTDLTFDGGDVLGDFTRGDDMLTFRLGRAIDNQDQLTFLQGTDGPAVHKSFEYSPPSSSDRFTLFWDTDDHQLFFLELSRHSTVLVASFDGMIGNVCLDDFRSWNSITLF